MLIDNLRAEYRERFVWRSYAPILKFDPGQPRNERGQWTEVGHNWTEEGGSGWQRSPSGERPYKDLLPRGDDYTVPTITHTKLVRDGGIWGSSHGNSYMMTGESATQMGIPGYKSEKVGAPVKAAVDKFLTAIADDVAGSEETLHHVFQNVRGTKFAVGDTLKLPLTATSGDVGHSYGTRMNAEDQDGQPTIFEFEPGTQMAPYGCYWTKRELEENNQTREETIKEFGHVWSEAIVAGGFEVTGVEEVYFGTQHSDRNEPGVLHHIWGKVVRLRQTQTFDPVTKKWVPRG